MYVRREIEHVVNIRVAYVKRFLHAERVLFKRKRSSRGNGETNSDLGNMKDIHGQKPSKHKPSRQDIIEDGEGDEGRTKSGVGNIFFTDEELARQVHDLRFPFLFRITS